MRIACIGAQNTGKTVFIKDVIKAFPNFSTPNETYRDIIKKHGLKINREGTIANQWVIFQALTEQYALTYDKDVILDRSPLDAYIYTVWVAKKPDGLEDMLSSAIKSVQTCDYIFYFPLAGNEHIKLKKDKLRDVSVSYREEIDTLFANLLLTHIHELPCTLTIIGKRKGRIHDITGLLK